MVPRCDYLASWRVSKESDDKSIKHEIVFENDPGRKDRNLVGRRHLGDILSMVQVSRELFLFWLGKSVE